MPEALAAILFFHGECVNLKISQLQLQLFFSIWVFFHEHSQFTGQQEKGEVICLTGPYHFYPLCSYLNIRRATSQRPRFCTQVAAGLEPETLIAAHPHNCSYSLSRVLFQNNNIVDIFTCKCGFRNNYFICFFRGSVRRSI